MRRLEKANQFVAWVPFPFTINGDSLKMNSMCKVFDNHSNRTHTTNRKINTHKISHLLTTVLWKETIKINSILLPKRNSPSHSVVVVQSNLKVVDSEAWRIRQKQVWNVFRKHILYTEYFEYSVAQIHHSYAKNDVPDRGVSSSTEAVWSACLTTRHCDLNTAMRNWQRCFLFWAHLLVEQMHRP